MDIYDALKEKLQTEPEPIVDALVDWHRKTFEETADEMLHANLADFIEEAESEL